MRVERDGGADAADDQAKEQGEAVQAEGELQTQALNPPVPLDKDGAVL